MKWKVILTSYNKLILSQGDKSIRSNVIRYTISRQ